MGDSGAELAEGCQSFALTECDFLLKVCLFELAVPLHHLDELVLLPDEVCENGKSEGRHRHGVHDEEERDHVIG